MRAPSGPDVVLGHGGSVGVLLAPVALDAERAHEPVHAAAGDRDLRGELAVRPAGVEQVAVVVGPVADAGLRRVGHADARPAVRVHRDAVGAGERAEVVIERAVLLHDEHEVVEVHDAGGRVERAERVGHRLQARRRSQRPAIDADRGALGRDREPVGHEERQRQLAGRAGPHRRRGSLARGGRARPHATHAAATMRPARAARRHATARARVSPTTSVDRSPPCVTHPAGAGDRRRRGSGAERPGVEHQRGSGSWGSRSRRRGRRAASPPRARSGASRAIRRSRGRGAARRGSGPRSASGRRRS